MSTRNPMNERYTSEERHGVSRKSAASAKPKTRAAATVYIKPTEKTPKEKKAARRAAQAREEEKQRKYYKPNTPRYRQLRRIWWGLIVGAVAATVLSFLLRGIAANVVTYVLIGIAYACIIGAFVLDITKVRKERQRYQEEMESKSKEIRAAQKRERAEKRAQKAEAAEKYAAAKEAEAEKQKKSVLGWFRKGKPEADADSEDAAAESTGKAKGSAASNAR